MRVVTLNTWKGDGVYGERLQLMAAQLATLQPDILCLQETLQTAEKELDTAGYLADFLDMRFIYAPSRWKLRTVEQDSVYCYSGLAILSRPKIINHQVDELLLHDLDPERIALSAEINVGGTALLITNLHLTHIKDEDSFRMEQLVRLIRTLKRTNSGSPWLCCGDYNRGLEQLHIQQLEHQVELHLEDCYLGGEGAQPGYTFINHENVHRSRRIDYILSLAQSPDTQPHCINSRIVLNSPDPKGVYPSDHYGVMCDFNLQPL